MESMENQLVDKPYLLLKKKKYLFRDFECKIHSAFTAIFSQIFPISLTICILGRSAY